MKQSNFETNIMDTLEITIMNEIKNHHLLGEVEISTSPNSLYIRPKKSDVLFSFELNKNNNQLIYSNSFLSKSFNFNRMIKSTCREIIKTLVQ